MHSAATRPASRAGTSTPCLPLRERVHLTRGGEEAPVLAALTLSDDTVAEDVAEDAVVGAIVGATEGSTVTLFNDAGGLFALDGEDILVVGPLDFETAESHDITLRETLAGASNSPRDSIITITVTDVEEAPTPLVTIDFKNGVYEWGGQSRTLGETVEENLDFAEWSPATIVPGVGIRLTGTDNASTGFVLTTGASDGILPSDGGVTAVVTYSLTTDASCSATIECTIGDLPALAAAWQLSFNDQDAGATKAANMVGNPVLEELTLDAGAAHKVAGTLIAAGFAGSADGNVTEVASGTPVDNSAATHIGVYCSIMPNFGGSATAILEKIEFYAPVDNADLPGLSAL